MESVLESFSNTTPTAWLITALLTVIVFFLKRFIRSVDEMKTSVDAIASAMVEHKTIVDEHDRRIEKIEDKLFR